MLEQDTRRRRKWLWGCGAGCLGFLVVLVVAGYIGYRYLMAPTPIVPAQAFTDAGTKTFLTVRIEADDEAMLDALATLSGKREFQELASGGDTPREGGFAADRLATLAPFQLALVCTADAEAEQDATAVIVSVSRGGRLVAGIAGASASKFVQPGEQAEEHGGVPIIPTTGGFMAPIKNSLIMASTRRLATLYVDRFNEQWPALQGDGEPPPAPPLDGPAELADIYARLDAGAPVVFAAVNTGGELNKIVKKLGDKVPAELAKPLTALLDAVTAAAVQLVPTGAMSGELTVFLQVADEENVQDGREVLVRLLEEAGATDVSADVLAEEGHPQLIKATARIEDLPNRAADLVVALIGK